LVGFTPYEEAYMNEKQTTAGRAQKDDDQKSESSRVEALEAVHEAPGTPTKDDHTTRAQKVHQQETVVELQDRRDRASAWLNSPDRMN
jgi:hypothetical protein